MIKLRVKTTAGQKTVSSLTADSSVADLLKAIEFSESLDEVKASELKILTGFPPSELPFDRLDLSLATVGIKSGDSVIVQSTTASSTESPSKKTRIDEPSVQNRENLEPKKKSSVIKRKVVPADNSCLFTSVHFGLSGQLDVDKASFMRDVISAAIQSDPVKYSEAILGRPIKDYTDWIRKPESWGGAIEAQVLAEYFGVVISVVDIKSQSFTHFGENLDSAHRMIVIYDGIHYDPLFREEADRKSTTLFPVTDEEALTQSKVFAAKAKEMFQFTDTKNFALRCITCNTPLKGETEAQSHAKSTGHTNFGEIPT